MVSRKQIGLLPKGYEDVLYPEAANEHAVIAGLLKTVADEGYLQVKPPIVEFEQSLLEGANAEVVSQTIRFKDAMSKEMLAIRSDMTGQVGRIATTRLASVERPLRLSYTGQVLRAEGKGLHAARQLTQMGIELIGEDALEADVEVMAQTVKALQSTGIKDLTLDIGISAMVVELANFYKLPKSAIEDVKSAIAKRDTKALNAISEELAGFVSDIMALNGNAIDVLLEIKTLLSGTPLAARIDTLDQIVLKLSKQVKDVAISIDLLEQRGFAYHTGVCFTVFAGNGEELARGGRYTIGDKEPAVGMTIMVNALMRCLNKK